MHEERGQQQGGHLVGPEEDPIEAVVPAGVREREDTEERDGQPEEMQCRLMSGPLDTDGRTDEQSEQTDRREQKIGR